MSEPVLRVEDLRVNYDDFIAVESASLSVEQGKIVSVVGLNGAGKSTLMNTIAGLNKPQSGKVFFMGKDITGFPAEKVATCGLSLVPQGGSIFNSMSVQDNLLMGSYTRNARPHAADALRHVYDLFPVLEEKKKSPAGTLSGGQRQMVAIGRALMTKPACLIFDEISLGLAPAVIKDIYRRIIEINATHHTSILLIEQDTQRALKASESFYVMFKGRVVMSGKSSEVDPEELKKAYFGM